MSPRPPVPSEGGSIIAPLRLSFRFRFQGMIQSNIRFASTRDGSRTGVLTVSSQLHPNVPPAHYGVADLSDVAPTMAAFQAQGWDEFEFIAFTDSGVLPHLRIHRPSSTRRYR